MNKNLLILLILFFGTSCSPKEEMSVTELKQFINDQDNGYAKVQNIGNWEYKLIVTRSEYFSKEGADNIGKGISCMLEVGNSKSGASLLPSDKGVNSEQGVISNYYTFDARHDGVLDFGDSVRIACKSYVFEPGLSIQNNDRLLYNFDLSQDLLTGLKDKDKFQFVFIDRVLGHGVVNFTLPMNKLFFLNDLKINQTRI